MKRRIYPCLTRENPNLPKCVRKEQLLWKESEFQKQFNGLDWMKLRAGDPVEWEKARQMESDERGG